MRDPVLHSRRLIGLMYMLAVSAFVFLDAVKVKSRVFVIVIGILFVLANINNIYNLIFGDGVRASSYSSIPYKGTNIPS